jgi:hypothetical protein
MCVLTHHGVCQTRHAGVNEQRKELGDEDFPPSIDRSDTIVDVDARELESGDSEDDTCGDACMHAGGDAVDDTNMHPAGGGAVAGEATVAKSQKQRAYVVAEILESERAYAKVRVVIADSSCIAQTFDHFT